VNQASSPREPESAKSAASSHEEFDHSSRCIDSTDLLQNHREITIRHGEETYRLRLTKSGKLILHK